MPQERVTVIVPAFHASGTIERTVRSIFGQPQVRPRVIVVVDDDEGKTEAVLSELADPRVEVVTNPGNLGAQKSRNRGLAMVESEYVMFLDSDDFVMGDLLHGLTLALADGADIAFGPWLFYDEGRNQASRRKPAYDNAAELLDRWLVRRQWTPPCAVMWRTEFLRRIGGWDEKVRRNQDGEVVCRAALAGARLAHSPQGCGVYVQHDSPLRISGNRSTFGDLVELAEALLKQPTEALPEPERQKILGDYFYWLADSAFRRGDREQGREAVKRGAELGGELRLNSKFPRLGAAVLGLETYRGVTSWMRGAND
ncbi:glycosyl transferase family 2 [Novosphingobium sp. PhB165]|uniref:glycosyltransferase family 2 protein n=1 Tax=Novosphingobium sp. PhB165 TaxID=2485105 RepID=UPI001047C618|nr:glycosyltransferase family 2 protein [Novosphingobium sp. PhB165]TCM20627.1 glycosyl transferase family 2 [Novosphingobium sp. PhB165]